MVLLLGASGFIGKALHRAFDAACLPTQGVSRAKTDYTRVDNLSRLIQETGASFVINAAGYTGKPNVDACEQDKAACLLGNAVLPGVVAEACRSKGIPWGHVSSGCIFSGEGPEGKGFQEEDAPNFCFRTNRCSFYSGSKALGEEALGWREVIGQDGRPRWLSGAEPDGYIWRLRIPFGADTNPRNYLQKLISYPTLLEATNSLSHLEEFASACVQCRVRNLPFGIYNLTNPGRINTKTITGMMLEENDRRRQRGQPAPFPDSFAFFESEEDFMRKAALAPRSNCVLDTVKATRAGLSMTPVEDAIRHCLQTWPAPQ